MRADGANLWNVTTRVRDDDPRTDLSPITVDGYSFPAAAVVDTYSDQVGVIRVAYEYRRKVLVVTEFGIVQPPKGQTISRESMEFVADRYTELVRNSVQEAAHELVVRTGAVDFQDVAAVREYVRSVEGLWRAIVRAGLPKRNSGETRPEYVARMWVDFYKPRGKTQEQLADDLGLAHITVRGYIHDQGASEKRPTQRKTRGKR